MSSSGGGISSWVGKISAAVVVVAAAGTGALLIPAVTGGGAGATITCDQTAANSAGLTSAISAASNGQTICLTAAVSYGTFTGTNKTVTIISQSATGAANPVANSITLSLGSGDSGFTIDGGMARWDSSVGLNINGCTCATSAQNITLKNFKSFSGADRAWNFSQPPNTGFVIDHAHFYNYISGEAAIYVDHSASEPASTGITIKNSLFRHFSADGIKLAGDNGVTILNNKFVDFYEANGAANHTDAIQFYSGAGSTVKGNWIDNCEQAISGFDGMGSNDISHNLVTRCVAHWFTNMWDRPASTWAFNTIGDSGGNLICGNKAEYSSGSQASLTNIRNNVARGISLTGEGATCTPTQNTNNLVNSGATAGNINGTPLFSGGSTLSTWDTFNDGCLTALSPGYTGATDGTQVGICGGDYNGTNYGPPVGEGY